jgi:hypothetical protein
MFGHPQSAGALLLQSIPPIPAVFEQWPPHQLQKLVLLFRQSLNGLINILCAVPALTDLGLSIPSTFFNVLCSTITIGNIPTDIGLALRLITICLQDKQQSDWFRLNDDELVMKMVELRWRNRQLSSIILLNADFRVDGNGRVERLSTEGLGITSQNGSFVDVIPPRLCLDIRKLM